MKQFTFDTMMVKPKCVWELAVFSIFKNLFKFVMWTATSQTLFGFTNVGSNMHIFRGTAIYFWEIINGTPCIWYNNVHSNVQPMTTGWPKLKFDNSNGYNSQSVHFWPNVGKAKMCLGGPSLIRRLERDS